MEVTKLNRNDLNALYDCLPIGVMALTRDRRVTVWNRQMTSWSGVPRSSIIDRTLGEAFSELDNGALYGPLQAVFDTGTPTTLSVTALGQSIPLRCPGGSGRTQQATVVPIQGADGASWALFAIPGAADLNGQKQSVETSKEDPAFAARQADEVERLAERHKEQLAELNRELEQFAHLASHDLQEPLRTLTSFSAFLKSDLGEDLPEAAARDLEHIVAASARMRRLIDGILALSRVSRCEMTWTPTPLSACVAEALTLLEDRIAESQPTIAIADDLPTVRGDRRLLTQVFENLMNNAMKFADASRPPQIQVSAERVNDGWLVKTADNGIGIAEAYATKIFAPFQRLHGPDKYPGSGMGLAICKRVVERHGGAIWTAPNEPHGSCFQFTLPDRQDHRSTTSCALPEGGL
jgi:signal transduction histidine kinase